MDIKTLIFYFNCTYYTTIFINDKKYTYGEIMHSEIRLNKVKGYAIENNTLIIKIEN